MVKANLRWITNPSLRANAKLLGYLDGKYAKADEFLTPYVVEREGESSLTIHKKYILVMGEVTQYFYEIEGEENVIRDLCERVGQVSFSPLELTYLGDMTDEEILGVIDILLPLVRKVYYGTASDDMSGTQIDRILFERFKNPSYIVFRPVVKQILSEQYDMLKEYRTHLPNPIGTIQQYFRYPSPDDGTHVLALLYLSEDNLADVRSKIKIRDLIGYTLLTPTSMPYHVLDEWSRAHDYNIDTALSIIKKIGPDEEIVVVNNDAVYLQPESLFWDLRDRALIKEDEGWFVLRIPEVQLADEGLRLYMDIANRFRFLNQTTYRVPNEAIFKPPEKMAYAFGFDSQEWLVSARKNIYQELPPVVTIEGRWNFLEKLTLNAKDLAKVAYAAFRGFSKVLNENDLLADFTYLINVNPDFSVSVPVYDLEEVQIIQEEMEAILSSPENIRATLCKDLESCVAARIKTNQDIPSSIPFAIIIGDQHLLISNSNLVLAKPEEYDDLVKDIDGYDASVQGFYDFGPAKGSVDQVPEPIEIEKGRVQVFDADGRWYSSVVLKERGVSKTIDLMSVEAPKQIEAPTKELDTYRDVVEDLWRSGWFLTNWGKSVYRKSGELSSHFLRDIASLKIKTFNDLVKFLES